MLLVDRSSLGNVAFARLARDGVVRDVLGDWALPLDVPTTRAVRLHMVRPLIPHNAWLSGLAALWLDGHAAAPAALDLVSRRGAHRIVPTPGSPPLRLHAGNVAGVPDADSPPVVTVARACLDALWHSPAAAALPATASALNAGSTSTDALAEMLLRFDRRTAGRRRVHGLVEALSEALAA